MAGLWRGRHIPDKTRRWCDRRSAAQADDSRKQIATLDRLSGGRLILGVGVGWLAEDFATLGVAFDGRGRLLESHLQAMREPWARGVSRVDNGHIDFDEVVSLPKPIERSVPVVFGGSTVVATAAGGQDW